jgi:hypothetical protein
MKATELSGNIPVDEAVDLIQAYKNCFASRAGQTVLGHMLFELGYFADNATEPGDVALKNYATGLLKRLAGYDDNVMLAAILAVPRRKVDVPLIRGLKNLPLVTDGKAEEEK